MRAKAAMMVAPGDFTVSACGHTITFKAGVETYVPPVMVKICERYNARQVKRFKDISAEIPAQTVSNTQSALMRHVTRGDYQEVEEVSAADMREAQSKSKVGEDGFTDEEQEIRVAITEIIDEGDASQLTADGKPQMDALNARIKGSIDSPTRNRIIGIMQDNGELPEDLKIAANA